MTISPYDFGKKFATLHLTRVMATTSLRTSSTLSYACANMGLI